MNRITKRMGALLLAVLLFAGLCVPAQADSTTNADHLKALGLFQGTDTGYDLENTATRIQGLIMMIRLLGEEDQAKAADPAKNPFTDVPDWAKCYTSYGVEKGYATGRDNVSYDPDGKMDFKSYTTLMLRAMGYNDKAGDFTWAEAPKKLVEIGMTDSASADAMLKEPGFYRAHIVDLSYSALTMKVKAGDKTLAQTLVDSKVFTEDKGKAEGVLGNPVVFKYTEPPKPPVPAETVTKTTQTYTLASGNVTADVVTANLANPKVSVKACMVENRVGATASFDSIVAASNAKAIVNANYFDSYQAFQRPIGHFMSEGQFLFCDSGHHSMGFGSGTDIRVGRVSVLNVVMVNGEEYWNCNSTNLNSQDYSNLYTPAYGASVDIPGPGMLIVVSGGTITRAEIVAKGEKVDIPADGFVVLQREDFYTTTWYKQPVVGTGNVTVKPILNKVENNDFSLDGLKCLVTGGPRLVKNSQQYLENDDPSFSDPSRFGPTAKTPRTAVGKTAEGKLIIVSTASASVQQLRELMLQLGCTDALCLDGGGSTALAYEGVAVRKPGRNLTTTLQVFVEP